MSSGPELNDAPALTRISSFDAAALWHGACFAMADQKPAMDFAGPAVERVWSNPRIRGAIAFAACAALAAVTYGVLNARWVSALDVFAVLWGQAHRDPGMTAVMELVSVTGGPSATSVYATALAIGFFIRRRYAAALQVAAIVYGGAGLNVMLKHAVHRGRPVLQDPLLNLPTYSYPSGHAAAAMVFGGLLITFALREQRATSGQRRAALVIAAWIVLVCASRVYLGAHYPTDVLAGILEGIAWLMVVLALFDALQVPLNWSPPDRSST